MIFKILTFFSVLVFINCGTFQNPLAGGADPWVIQYNRTYYYCRSEGERIAVLKSRKLQDIARGERKVVYAPPPNKPYSKDIWAPELHHINNKWYIYFAADDGNNNNHRMYVIESDRPQGNYVFKGKISDRSNKWAIDGTVLQAGKNLFFVWSGWMGNSNGRQDLFIARMSNPWTIVGDRVLISTPTQAWEKRSRPYVPGGINEGPEAFVRGNKHYIIYSASGSWSDEYCLGWIMCNNANRLMDPKCWQKHGPVFTKSEKAYGPGHASFTKSPDGKQDWMVYHACEKSGGGWDGRSIRIQQFIVRDGTPSFGRPAKCHVPIVEPSGS